MDANFKQKLAQKIEDAFSNTLYPGDDAIGRNEVKEFRGHWKSIPIELIKRRRGDIDFFSIKGFRYYLPSFLTAVILYPERVDTLVDSIVRILTPPLDRSDMNQFIEGVEIFSDEEKAVIFSFLESYKELFPTGNWAFFEKNGQRLERALDFWKQYQ